MAEFRTLAFAAAALCVAASGALMVSASGPFSLTSKGRTGDVWQDADWPFGRDGWPNGRGFVCPAGDCGVRLNLYARLKKGFCNCTTGVADDDEIDRVGDIDLVSRDFAATGPGAFRTIADTPGRIREYAIEKSLAGEKSPAGRTYVLSLASGRNCDAFVAMAVADEPFTPKAVEAAARFVNEPAFLKWVDSLR